MKTIIIDISSVLSSLRSKNQPTGVERVILAYLRHYQDRIQLAIYLRRLGRVFIFSHDSSKKIIALILQWDLTRVSILNWLLLKYGVFEFFKKQELSNCIFMKLCMKRTKKGMYFQQVKLLNATIITMYHDIVPVEKSNLISKHHARFLHDAFYYSAGIITVSGVARDALMNYATMNNRCCPPTISSGLASNFSYNFLVSKRQIIEPYFIIVGSLALPRKNHLLLLKIWMKLVDKLGKNAPKLVIFGTIAPSPQKELTAFLKHPSLQNIVIQLQENQASLINYIHHAQALLLPSLIENASLPLVEALSLRTPVIANNLPSFHEIAGDVPDYIEVAYEEIWLQYIIDYMQPESQFRQQQLTRIKHFVLPTWDDHFVRVDQFLERVDKAS